METLQTLIAKAGPGEIELIRGLAHEIWPDAYGEILSPEQLRYMLQLIYSSSALQRQMEEGQEFLILRLNGDPAGFAAWSAFGGPGTYKLHKLYVKTGIQGKGLGRALLEAVETRIAKAGGGTLLLNVNRYNKARSFYEKHGFQIAYEEDIPIGQDYYMNDYIMTKPIAPQ